MSEEARTGMGTFLSMSVMEAKVCEERPGRGRWVEFLSPSHCFEILLCDHLLHLGASNWVDAMKAYGPPYGPRRRPPFPPYFFFFFLCIQAHLLNMHYNSPEHKRPKNIRLFNT